MPLMTCSFAMAEGRVMLQFEYLDESWMVKREQSSTFPEREVQVSAADWRNLVSQPLMKSPWYPFPACY